MPKFIPNIIDIQLDPRLEGEPFFFTDRMNCAEWNCKIMRIGPFKFFAEYKTV